MILKNFLQSAGNLLFPKNFTCDICGGETFKTNLCADCLKTVTFNDKTVCPVCGRKTKTEGVCIECKSRAPYFKRAASPLVYDNGAVKLIAKFKNGYAYLKDWFAAIMCEKLKDFSPFDCIVYVPMTQKMQFKRGYNQSNELAQAISKICGVPVAAGAVVKIKDTEEQKSLSRKERENNLKSAFKVIDKAAIKGKTVLIVDDVLTTGATADALSKKLLNAGATATFLVTVASVEYKTPYSKKSIDNPSPV